MIGWAIKFYQRARSNRADEVDRLANGLQYGFGTLQISFISTDEIDKFRRFRLGTGADHWRLKKRHATLGGLAA